MGGGGKAPQRNLYAETSDELTAKADLAPRVYATEAEFAPRYTALELQGIEQSLLGTKAGTREEQYTDIVTKYRNPITGELSDSPGTYVDPKDPSSKFGSTNKRPLEQVRLPVAATRTIQTPAQKGIVDIGEEIGQRIAKLDSASLSAQREADIGDVSRLGGISLAAQQNADPRTAALIERLTTDANDELGMGYDMTPAQMRLAQQSVRARHQGTLANTGRAGDLKEALGISQFALDLRDKRKQQAAGVVGLRQAIYGDSFNRVLGRPASASPQGYISQAQGISSRIGPQLFGSTINANELASDNANINAANRAAAASANQTYAGAGIGAAGAMGAALIALCWVAREVYGVQNPKWLQFREWLTTRAPAGFQRWYVKHGERFAQYLADKPELKARWRCWMDGKIMEVHHVL